MEHDPGRSAMWMVVSVIGLLRAKGVVLDSEFAELADALERDAAGTSPQQRADMERAAQALRHTIPAAND